MSASWLWIGGWGLPPAWLHARAQAARPEVRHTVLPPTESSLEQLASASPTHLVGYSLGALLLLSRKLPPDCHVLLLAPCFSWVAEHQLGSRIHRTQLRYLLRWLDRDPLAALADFYRRAGLSVDCPTALPYPMEDLRWGVRQMLELVLPPGLPPNSHVMVGELDPLLDIPCLRSLIPGLCHHPAGTHDPATLLHG